MAAQQDRAADRLTYSDRRTTLESRVKYSRVASRKQYRRSMENFAIMTLTVALLLRIFVLNMTYVKGSSMQPTLIEGERVIVLKAAYAFSEPKRFDIVVCKFPGEEDYYVKRVIGLPGEKVELRGREGIFIDGRPLDGDIYGIGYNPRNKQETVGANEYFLMGDNRAHSQDSAMLGALDKKHISGKAVLVMWPMNNFKFL